MTKVVFNKLEVNDVLSKEDCVCGSVVEHHKSKEKYLVCTNGWLQLTSNFQLTNPRIINYQDIGTGEYWRLLPSGTSFTITTDYKGDK